VNGDGGMDLVIGAPNDNQGGGNASGAVFVVAGMPPPTPPPPPPTPTGAVTRYCTAGPNAYGPGASLGHAGSTSFAAEDFVLRVEGARPRGVGFFLYGAERAELPFMQGFLCIGQPRYTIGHARRLDHDGAAELELASAACRKRQPAIVVGSTWNFQFLYVDPQSRGRGKSKARCGPFNLSDALAATFVP
jgi:hypothetical protein